MGNYELSSHSTHAVDTQSTDPHNESLPHTASGPPSQSNSDGIGVRKVFNSPHIFFFALTYMSSWETMALNLQAALVNGGSPALAWGILIIIAGALAQSASLAEMASALPIAGAQYHWTYAFAPERHRRFITWMQGVVTCFAWISMLAGVVNITAYMLQSLMATNNADYQAERWHVTMIIFAFLLVGGLVNVFAWPLIPWIETLSGVLHIVLFVVFEGVLLTMASKHNAEFVFFKSASSSGWNNGFASFLVGLTTPSWGFVGIWLAGLGFDGVIHLSEEVRKAHNAVPNAIFWTVALNGVLAYAFSLTVLFCLGDLSAATNADFPIIEICTQATDSKLAATVMVSALMFISFAVTLGSIASASRLIWAWSRDGGLPAWFSHINAKRRIPARSVCLPIAVVMVLACLNIGSDTAFLAFISLSSLTLFTSYAIAISCALYARRRKRTKESGWSLGKYGASINVFALVYTAWMMVVFCFPQYLPVTAENFNYALPIFATIVVIALTFWFARAGKHWSGPDESVIERVLADSEQRSRRL